MPLGAGAPGEILPVLPVAFAAGAGASLASCTILRLPVIFGYSAAAGESVWQRMKLSLAFSAGLIISFTLMGLAFHGITGLSRYMDESSRYLYWFLGILLIAAGLLFAGLIPSPRGWLRDRCAAVTRRISSPRSSFVFGMFFAVLELPTCPGCGAALLGLAGFSFMSGAVWDAVLLFVSYAAGQCVPVIAAGFSAGLLIRRQERAERAAAYLNLFAGNLLLAAGIAFIIIS